MPEPLLIAKNDATELLLLPGLANRHGLIAGATGAGKDKSVLGEVLGGVLGSSRSGRRQRKTVVEAR